MNEVMKPAANKVFHLPQHRNRFRLHRALRQKLMYENERDYRNRMNDHFSIHNYYWRYAKNNDIVAEDLQEKSCRTLITTGVQSRNVGVVEHSPQTRNLEDWQLTVYRSWIRRALIRRCYERAGSRCMQYD